MVKICIISAAEDKILEKFISSLVNITEDFHCYILRNKPTKIDVLENDKITMKIVDNKNYRNDNNGFKFLKARIDSVAMASSNTDDVIMLGDDDMIFREGFKFAHNPAFNEGFDFCVATKQNCVVNGNRWRDIGCWFGFYCKYNKKIWKELDKYKDFVGAGEDGIIGFKHYEMTKGKGLWVYVDDIVHIGYNTYLYQSESYDSSLMTFHLFWGASAYEDKYYNDTKQIFNLIYPKLRKPKMRVFAGERRIK